MVESLDIDVAFMPASCAHGSLPTAASIVLVEPLLAGAAAAVLLEQVDRVELVDEGDLVDLERVLSAAPASEGAFRLCAVDALRAMNSLHEFGATEAIVASHLNVRVVAARLASSIQEGSAERARVMIVCADTSGDAGGAVVSVDAIHCAGVLIRMLLEEILCPCVLTDAAGVAVTVAGSYGDPHAAMQTSARWRSLLRAGAAPSMLSIASQRDLAPAVPYCDLSGEADDRRILVPWPLPTSVSAAPTSDHSAQTG